MGGARIVVTGATGMVGGIVLRRLLDDARVASVTTLGRRSTGRTHDKLRDHDRVHFDDLSTVKSALEHQDAAIFCLGTYTGKVPDELFKRITFDFAVHFGRALLEMSPGAAFVLLSGQGADPSGKSRMSFARYKGMAENELRAMAFSRVHIMRPAYIYPVEARDEPGLSYRLARALYPALQVVASDNMHITSEQLAEAMVHAALEGTGEHDDPVLENRDIRHMLGI